jgi:hypothetical protein
VGRREKTQEGGGEKMNFVENYENLAKACYDAGETFKNFAEAVRKAEKAANRPNWPKTYSERKRKKG